MTLGEFLRSSGLSQRALARRLGVSDGTVSKWLHGRILPDARRLAELERLTGGQVTAADFLRSDPGQGSASLPPRPALGLAEAQVPYFADSQDALFTQPSASIVAEAKALGLDADAIARQAVRAAISAEKARRWAEENRAAIEAWNRHFEENDTPLAEYRMF